MASAIATGGIVGHQTRPFDERNQPDERPGNRPSEQQERDPRAEKTAPTKRAISGPGAADFIAAAGGEDRPGISANKGMSQVSGDSELTNPRNLIPRPGPDTEAHPGERRPDEDRSGSATGTIGGGGPDAHNASPVRATGVDDPSSEKITTNE
jgi:hypothetical protein